MRQALCFTSRLMTTSGTLRRSADAMLPFFFGIIVGVLSAYAGIAGRIATLEAHDVSNEKRITAVEASQRDMSDYLRAIALKVGANVEPRVEP